MTNKEKGIRIQDALRETNHLLEKANKNYSDSIKYLIMEIEDNKELGNTKQANFLAVGHANKDKARVKELQDHKKMLESMYSSLN